MPKPIVTVAKFHREHNTPWGQQPDGRLYHGLDNNRQPKKTLGFLRGEKITNGNLQVGFTVEVVYGNRVKVWTGSITRQVSDNYSPSEGDAFFIELTNSVYTDDASSDDTIVVTVTATDPGSNSTSAPMTASPNPVDVP
jgi:hypothetical protein